MRRWILRRLGASEWLIDIEDLSRQFVDMSTRRDKWQVRAEELEAQLMLAEALARGFEESGRGAEEWAAAAEERATESEKRARVAEHERAEMLGLTRARIEDALSDLVEPKSGEPCRKVRCHNKDVAVKLARSTERRVLLPPLSMTVYTCDRCAPQPISNERWWHVCMADQSMRRNGKHGEESRKTWRPPMNRPLVSENEREALRRRLLGDAS